MLTHEIAEILHYLGNQIIDNTKLPVRRQWCFKFIADVLIKFSKRLCDQMPSLMQPSRTIWETSCWLNVKQFAWKPLHNVQSCILNMLDLINSQIHIKPEHPALCRKKNKWKLAVLQIHEHNFWKNGQKQRNFNVPILIAALLKTCEPDAIVWSEWLRNNRENCSSCANCKKK
jgi:hypothetical protein